MPFHIFFFQFLNECFVEEREEMSVVIVTEILSSKA